MNIIKKVVSLFIIWRVSLFTVAFIATILIPKFGNRFPYWDMMLVPTGLPSWIWSFGNFDGVHYLRIVTMGYESSQYSQAFFPLYPILIKIMTIENYYFISAIVLSNLLLLLAIYVFYRLLRIDYEGKICFRSIILLLSFPTAYYFGSIYSESLFFFLTVSSLFFLRKDHYLVAGFFGALASATRILGLLLIPVFLIDIYIAVKKGKLQIKSEQFFKAVISTLIPPLGLLLYMWYLKVGFNNPLYFLTSQPAFGAERSSLPIVLLPQVFFRYIKMLITVPVNSWQFFSSALELTFAIIAVMVLVGTFKKIRFSYWVFSLGCVIVPTLTGTFSSMPRYILMMFLLLPFLAKLSKKYFILLTILFIILGMLLVAFFTRGYWIA